MHWVRDARECNPELLRFAWNCGKIPCAAMLSSRVALHPLPLTLSLSLSPTPHLPARLCRSSKTSLRACAPQVAL